KPAIVSSQGEQYFLAPKSLFDRQKLEATPARNAGPLYSIRVGEKGPHIKVQFERRRSTFRGKAHVQISGLRKYLPHFDTLTLRGVVSDVADVFHAWGAIEEALIKRSRFFTLIDIYGHYANRGDTVNITSMWSLDAEEGLVCALNWFGTTANCGDFIQEGDLAAALKVRKTGLLKTIEALRAIRFDVRTSNTHPIIGKNRVICTYPFPLLSPRALVESRARLSLANGDEGMAEAS